MNIETLTIGEARQIAALFAGQPQIALPQNDAHWRIGGNYFIRTVTHHLTGKLVAVTPQELVVEEAAWIADDGRFSDAVNKSVFNEVEPFRADGRVIIGRGSLIDACEIETLPKEQK